MNKFLLASIFLLAGYVAAFAQAPGGVNGTTVSVVPASLIIPHISFPVADWRVALGSSLSLVLPDGTRRTYAIQSVDKVGDRVTIKGVPEQQGEFVVICAMKDYADMVVSIVGERSYEVHLAGDEARVVVVSNEPVPCGVPPSRSVPRAEAPTTK